MTPLKLYDESSEKWYEPTGERRPPYAGESYITSHGRLIASRKDTGVFNDCAILKPCDPPFPSRGDVERLVEAAKGLIVRSTSDDGWRWVPRPPSTLAAALEPFEDGPEERFYVEGRCVKDAEDGWFTGVASEAEAYSLAAKLNSLSGSGGTDAS